MLTHTLCNCRCFKTCFFMCMSIFLKQSYIFLYTVQEYDATSKLVVVKKDVVKHTFKVKVNCSVNVP